MACTFGYTTISIVFIICFSLLKCFHDDPSSTYEILYEKGIEAYKMGNWFACASYLHRSIQDYKLYVEAVINCRLNCKKSVISAEAAGFDFESNYCKQIVKISDCLQRCKRAKLGKRAEIPASLVVDKKFEDRMPYDYLQFSYFKLGKNKEAAAASYTYFITHQDDQRIINNLKYYKKLEGVTDEDFKDLESNAYQNSYASGLHAYSASDWTSTVEHMEESLRLYFEEEEKCRAACEEKYSHKGHPDFTIAAADHYLVILICQYKCEEKLSAFGEEFQPNFVSEHYNFLQFAYFKVKDTEKAVRAVATFLLFQPDHEIMLRNKAYYMRNFGFHQGHFIPFEEAKQYYERRKIFIEIIDYVKTEYAMSSDKQMDGTSKAWRETKPSSKETNNSHTNHQPFMEYSQKIGVTIVAESSKLNGSSHLAADGFLNDKHCYIISDLIRKKKPDSTGVRQITILEMLQVVAKEHMRTKYTYDFCIILASVSLGSERKPDSTGVRQITIPEILQVVAKEHENEMYLRLLHQRTEIVRQYISTYYNSTGLFVKQVKVVCRERDDEWEKNQHKDCILQEDGSCINTFSHFSDQEYIGVVYLTNISEGTGQLYFLDKENKIQSSLAPRCGRLMIFKASDRHGVNPSWVNERCSLFVHLTPNMNDEDKSQRQVKEFLKKFDEGVKIIQAGEKDLLGRERLVADGLATEEECTKLINLTRKGGLYGDGYNGKTSPHTDSETFLGVSVYRAIKLVQQKATSVNVVQLALDISEMSRLMVEKFLNLSRPLYFDYTHLVCRTAKEGYECQTIKYECQTIRYKLHYRVQVPNHEYEFQFIGYKCQTIGFKCQIIGAILYLNEDIEGGDFFFAYPNTSVQVSVQPKCGRLVAFNAGEFHGVKAVLKGQRCALAMWYTMDPDYNELSRLYARRVFSKMMEADDEIEDAVTDEVQNKNAGDQNLQSSSQPASKESQVSDAKHTDTSKEINSSMMEAKSTTKEKEEL
ncbi:hypothetical protein CHS0354_036134 [Potamilus streckersoni]|uniref:procollagen-proline 3-dioxygenase n=1 Tax=Potamilus streckersoni TaxID=2493646 RepID=A0AAE0T3M6_9BIVA|nr:hypothetical protein CHS0354_036134 [Potamilus streckersoni]